MAGKLMHGGKPWTGEGFPPDSPESVAVLGVDPDTPVCVCAQIENEDGSVGWNKEGHATTCPCAQPPGVKSVVGKAGEGVTCSCSAEWKGEGHQKDCPKRAGVAPCTCKALKWDGEGHSPECVSRQVASEDAHEPKTEKRHRK